MDDTTSRGLHLMVDSSDHKMKGRQITVMEGDNDPRMLKPETANQSRIKQYTESTRPIAPDSDHEMRWG
jgi:hypothetical protein